MDNFDLIDVGAIALGLVGFVMITVQGWSAGS
jgi:hypothetical protein